MRPKQVFIHIGLPKTASSFLQKKVFPNISNIKLIANPETQIISAFNKLIYADDCFYDERPVIEEINKIDEAKILISDESLAGQPFNLFCINKSQIANRLQKLFPDASILLFVRGQKEMLLSLYSQYIKVFNGTKNLGEFYLHPEYIDFFKLYKKNRNFDEKRIRHYNFLGHSHLDCLLYYETIMLYKKLFEKVDVILYEDFRLNPKGIILQLENIFKEKFLNEAYIDYDNFINSRANHVDFQKILFFNKSKFVLRKKILCNLFYLPYKIFYCEKIEEKENYFLEKIAKEYYSENNRKIISEFPEIGLEKYPEYYKF